MTLVNVGEQDEVGQPRELTLGRTLDLSHDGVRIQLDHPVLLRSRVRLALALENHIIEAEASVRDVEEYDDNTVAVGVKFHDLSPADQERLDEFLRLHAPAETLGR
jgi:c-di-GMP-binding flagellar brake protein YcgR